MCCSQNFSHSLFEMLQANHCHRPGPIRHICIQTYDLIVFMRGIDNFVRSLKETGADGLIVPDLPPEEIEAEEYFSSCEQHKLHPILIFAPSCGDERLKFLNHVKTLPKADRTAQDSVNHDASGSATVFMYSGHGSHCYHMGKEFYSNDQAFKHAFDQCDEIVADLAGFSLAHIVYQQSNPFQDFNETRATHPACFTFNYAMYKTLEVRGITADYYLGYGPGEYNGQRL